MQGKIKRLPREKNFGFIEDSEGKEYFFHHSAIKNARFEDLKVGQEVEFEDVLADKGLRAEDIFI